MKKSIKILISVIIILLAMPIAVCLFGINVGGIYGASALICFVVVSAVLALISGLIIFGKEEIKTEKAVTAMVIILICSLFSSYVLYGQLNSLTGSTDESEYQATIISVDAIRGLIPMIDPEYEIVAEKPSGETIIIPDYSFAIDYEEGDTINVTEKTGGFGIKTYKIEK